MHEGQPLRRRKAGRGQYAQEAEGPGRHEGLDPLDAQVGDVLVEAIEEGLFDPEGLPG